MPRLRGGADEHSGIGVGRGYCCNPNAGIIRIMRKMQMGTVVKTAALLFTWALAGWVFAEGDPGAIVGPGECAECHENIETIWKKTAHYRTFREAHRSEKGKKFVKALGIKRMKSSDAPCAQCHYTVRQREGKKLPRAIAGVSCESCHGAAKEWIKVHSEFSGKEEEEETSIEEAKRWVDSEIAGMIRPGNVYRLAQNCMSCHLTPNEDIVNAGHPIGSDFELVAWSQGEVRHNIHYTDENNEASPARKRILFVAGAVAELESALRALAEGGKGDYADNLISRAKAASKKLNDIAKVADAPEVKAMADAAGVEFKSGDKSLSGVADKIAEQSLNFFARVTGAELSGIDPMLPAPSEYAGDAAAL